MSNQSRPEEAYFDRNQLALAFARMALRAGWTAGLGVEPEDSDWPVLYVDTPEGQISWHLPASEVDLETWPNYPGSWDGHDVDQKRRRLAALIHSPGDQAQTHGPEQAEHPDPKDSGNLD